MSRAAVVGLHETDHEVTEPSSQRLVSALEGANLYALAERAKRDEFHDFNSPHAMPQHVLVEELHKAGGLRADHIAARVRAGDFDAGLAESEKWAQSSEGKAAFRSVLGEDPPE